MTTIFGNTDATIKTEHRRHWVGARANNQEDLSTTSGGRNLYLPNPSRKWRAAIYTLLTLISSLALVHEVRAQVETPAAAKYDVIEIPPLAGQQGTRGIAIAERAPIVAFNSIDALLVKAAVCQFDPVKPANGCANTDLDEIGSGGSGATATVNAILPAGTPVVGLHQTMNGSPPDRAFCVDTPLAKEKLCGGIIDLPTLGGNYSNALGTSRDNRFIYGFATDNNDDQNAAFWVKNTLKIQKLARLSKDYPAAAYGGTNSYLTVGVGEKQAKGGGLLRRAVWWNNKGAVAELDAPPDNDSSAIASNFNYDVLGTTGSQPDSKGAFWKCSDERSTPATCKWTRIDFSSRVATGAVARMSINDDRIAVGQVDDEKKGPRAILWDLDAEKIADVDLNDLIDPKLGWTLTEATGINDDGVIVGSGTLNGSQRGYILVPKK
jgi:uncharacterized membrane protein